MIVSVEEALREGLAKAFSDWVDDPLRNLVWNHHLSAAILHEESCPDDECCDPMCDGDTGECCCNHMIDSVVSATFQMYDRRPGAAQYLRPVTSGLVLPLGVFLSQRLPDFLTDIREAMEQKATEDAVMGSLRDVEAEMRNIIEGGE